MMEFICVVEQSVLYYLMMLNSDKDLDLFSAFRIDFKCFVIKLVQAGRLKAL